MRFGGVDETMGSAEAVAESTVARCLRGWLRSFLSECSVGPVEAEGVEGALLP